jgi:O-acetyl-ADP-ribose deacetylase (regulator of RNase III)
MPFLMIRNDITKVAADAIVNPANRNLLQGSGTSRAIYQAAGEQELTAACEAIGHCEPGRAVCTPAFGLPAKHIFHALRNAVSLGGDSDTLACITGGIAEAFYGMPQELRAETLKRLPEDLRAAYELFRQNLERRM